MSRTRPEGVDVPEDPPAKKQGLLWGLSIALTAVISFGVIMGFVGKTLYVTRDEYVGHTTLNVEDKAIMRQTMQRVEDLLSRQEVAFEKLSDVVQTVRLQMASQPRGK